MTAGCEIMVLPIFDITIADRIGFFDAAHAACPGGRITADGQHDPINVRRNGNAAKLPWTLVGGLHRLRDATAMGMLTMDAVQVADAGSSADDVPRWELSENFDRQRRPSERVMVIMECAPPSKSTIQITREKGRRIAPSACGRQ